VRRADDAVESGGLAAGAEVARYEAEFDDRGERLAAGDYRQRDADKRRGDLGIEVGDIRVPW
jgi:hypothetical protein